MTDEISSDEHHRLVDNWLREYVSVENQGVGRSGPVCPFIPRALSEYAVETRLRYDIDGSNESELIDEMRAEIAEFCKADRPSNKSGVTLKSRLIVMPRMAAEGWTRLDTVYDHLKGFAVESGSMIGQFHPNCDERAVRNSGFRVSIAPLALLAIRYMAPHDILFLHPSARWFKEYYSRFHSHFQRGRIRDPFLLSLYSSACDRHGIPA